MKKKVSFATGDKIITRRGYFGVVYGQNVDESITHVGLTGCTYDDEHWYDSVPTKDIRLATKAEIKKWTF